MEYTQAPFDGAPLGWSFPSPATPTNGSFGHNVYQTPKANAYQIHFQDAFSTPQMPLQATPQAFQYPTTTPLQRPQTSSETLRSNYYANVQAAGMQSAGPVMAPPVPVLSPTNAHNASIQLAMNTSFGSTQMQTPPPTRGTSTKKQQQPQDQQIAFGTPSTIASRRYMTPQQPMYPQDGMQPVQNTSVGYPQLQFSPDMYHFNNIGPASAPVISHSKVLWAQTNSPLQAVPSTTLNDPFAPASFDMGWPSSQIPQTNAQMVSFDTPAMNSFPVQTPLPTSMSFTDTVPMSAAASAGAAISSTSVDPSLVYSSPARPIIRSANRTKKARQHVTSVDSTADMRPAEAVATLSSTETGRLSALGRSNTTTTVRPKSMSMPRSVTDSFSHSMSGSLDHITRTASPVKRLGRPSLGSITEGRPRHRRSVILTIDENGRARTETQPADESPTRSIRERYPALFDSDTSDAESDGSEGLSSRPTSFIFDKREQRRTKAARLEPPVESLEGLTIPRSSSAASMKKGVPPSRAAVAAAAQLRRQGSLRRSTPSRNQNRRSFMSASNSSLIDTAPLDMSSFNEQDTIIGDDMPNSGSFIAVNSANAPPSSAESTLEAHNRRWSIMSLEQQKRQSISPQQHQAPFEAMQSYVPPQGQDMSIEVHCICGSSDPMGMPLVQCQSCARRLHAACVGIDRIPLDYTCSSCRPQPVAPLRSRGSIRR